MEQSSLLALLEKKKRKLEDSHLKHSYNHNKRFICPSDITGDEELGLAPFWTDDDLGIIFPNLSSAHQHEVRKRSILCLTILVWIGWHSKVGHTGFSNGFLEHFHPRAAGRIRDNSLPLADEDERIFQALGGPMSISFLRDQYMFKPYIISMGDGGGYPNQTEINRQPLPFLKKPVKISEGGFAGIYRAEIARGCFEDDRGDKTGKIIAFKKFQHSTSFDFKIERDVLRKLRRQLESHTHIGLHLSDLVWNGKCFIFFKYARLGDLETLFIGGFERPLHSEVLPHPGKRLYIFEKEFVSPHQALFIEQLRNLADALDYLHRRFGEKNGGRILGHMDLKPHNVLIYPKPAASDSSNVGNWLIADFGISSFTRRPSINSIDVAVSLDESYYSLGQLHGAWRAPELQVIYQRQDPIHCDIWAFGCIMNEVFAFIVDGPNINAASGVASLADFRQRKGKATRVHNAWFDFDFSKSFDPDENMPTLNGYVDHWLQKKAREDATWRQDLSVLIQRALSITDTNRPPAFDLYSKLDYIFSNLRSSIKPKPEPFRLAHHEPTSRDTAVIASPHTPHTPHTPHPPHSAGVSDTSSGSGSFQTALTTNPRSRALDSIPPKFPYNLPNRRHSLHTDSSIDLQLTDVKDFAVASNCSLVAYLYKRGAKSCVTLLAPDPHRHLQFKSHVKSLADDCAWQGISLDHGLLIVSGRRGKSDVREIFDVREPTSPKSHAMDCLPLGCLLFAVSFKIVAWVGGEYNGNLVYIWSQATAKVLKRKYKGSVTYIKMNATATLLYVLEDVGLRCYLHVLCLDPMNSPAQSTYWDRPDSLECKIWPAQQDRLCVVQDVRHGVRKLIAFDGDGSFEETIDEPENVWDFAMTDRTLITVRRRKIEKGRLFKSGKEGLYIGKRQISRDQPSSILGDESKVAHPGIEDRDVRVAAHSSNGFERIVACGKSGRYFIQDNPLLPPS